MPDEFACEDCGDPDACYFNEKYPVGFDLYGFEYEPHYWCKTCALRNGVRPVKVDRMFELKHEGV